MNAVFESSRVRTTSEIRAGGPCVAVVTPHKATYFKPLYEAFARAQPHPWRTEIVWPAEHRSEHPGELLTPVASNLAIHRVRGRARGPWHFPPPDLKRLLARLSPRAVLAQEYGPMAVGAIWFAWRRRIPVVVLTEVGRRNAHFFSVRTRLWHAFWSRWIDGIVAACPAAHEPPGGRWLPAMAAYHAVDSRLYRPLPKYGAGPVVFAYVGQLIPRKGLDLWLEAAKLLSAGGRKDFRLRLIGGGDDAWLRAAVAAAGLESQVEWCGFLSGAALREALGTSDVFVLPSRRDTYAAVAHEAACLGLPLLLSRHAGAAEAMVREGENGFVIDPENATTFAQHMRLMMESALRERMAAAARAMGERMSAHRRGAHLWEWMRQQFALPAE